MSVLKGLGGCRERGCGRYMETEEFRGAFEELLTLIEREECCHLLFREAFLQVSQEVHSRRLPGEV